MTNFVLFCKSYLRDIEQLKCLVKSYLRYNKDGISLIVSVPRADFPVFDEVLSGTGVKLLIDEEVSDELVSEPINGISPGYINQEILKLTFWKTLLAANYFCIDSDSYFIRDFYLGDFMFDEQTPYSVLQEDKELCVDPLYYKAFWEGRYESLLRIKQHLGFSCSKTLTCHNNTTFSAKVLAGLEEQHLRVNNMRYADLISISPYEFSWYNFWLQKSKIIPVIAVEPFFKFFHLKEHYLEYKKKGIREADIARAYLGICLNSNTVRCWGEAAFTSYDEGPESDPRSIRYRILAKLARLRRKLLFQQQWQTGRDC